MHKLCKASFFDRVGWGGARSDGGGGAVEKEKWPRVSSLFPRRGSLTLVPPMTDFSDSFCVARRGGERNCKCDERRSLPRSSVNREYGVNGSRFACVLRIISRGNDFSF